MVFTGESDFTDTTNDDEYYIPLVDQRVFGAGLKRKRIAFVPASTDESTTKCVHPASDARNRYLSIVLGKGSQRDTSSSRVADLLEEENAPTHNSNEKGRQAKTDEERSQVGLLSDPRHDTSIAHQLAFEHSYAPSHLDRDRLGMRYLQDYGWDPDAREGLGSRREGIRIPVKAVQKKDTTGLGLIHSDKEILSGKAKKVKSTAESSTVTNLNAKQVRIAEEAKKRRGEKLRLSVYGQDWSRYLGEDGQL